MNTWICFSIKCIISRQKYEKKNYCVGDLENYRNSREKIKIGSEILKTWQAGIHRVLQSAHEYRRGKATKYRHIGPFMSFPSSFTLFRQVHETSFLLKISILPDPVSILFLSWKENKNAFLNPSRKKRTIFRHYLK